MTSLDVFLSIVSLGISIAAIIIVIDTNRILRKAERIREKR